MGVETMMMAAAVASAAGTALEGVDAFRQSRYRASVLRNQSDAARNDAGNEVQLSLEDSARRTGEAITKAAKGGGLAGSALDVLNDLSRQQTYEAQRIATEGDNASRALREEARQTKRQGNIALVTSLVKAGASLAGAPNASGDGTLLTDAMAKRGARGAAAAGRTTGRGIAPPAAGTRGVW